MALSAGIPDSEAESVQRLVHSPQWVNDSKLNLADVVDCIQICVLLLILLPFNLFFAISRHFLVGPICESWSLIHSILHSSLKTVVVHFHPLGRHSVLLSKSMLSLISIPSWSSKISKTTLDIRGDGPIRNLLGIDASTTFTRSLNVEWVTHNLLQEKQVKKCILYLHGGAFFFLSKESHRSITAAISGASNANVFAINYRLAPESLFPCGLEDALAAYLFLIKHPSIKSHNLHVTSPVKSRKYRPEDIIIAGDSSGGGMALSILLLLKQLELPLPMGAILMSPHVDAMFGGQTWITNRDSCWMTPNLDGCIGAMKHYASPLLNPGTSHPLLSPLFGDLSRLCPILVQVGTAEVLYADSVRLVERLKSTGSSQVVFEEYSDMFHVFQSFPFLDATRRSFEAIGDWVRMLNDTVS